MGWRTVCGLAATLFVVAVGGAAGAPPHVTADLFGRTQQGPWYDAAGNPSWTKLRNDVHLRDAGGRIVATARPNVWGEFRFARVDVGTYTLEFTYESLHDPVFSHRTYRRTLTWAHKWDSWEVLVDIDPYTNTPSYEQAVNHLRCPAAVKPGRGCNP